MPDHVHIFVRSQPTIAPNRIAAALKGYKDTKTRVFRVKVQTSYVME